MGEPIIKMKIGIFLLLSIFIVFGCADQIEPKSLVGKYVANNKKAAETLEINANGSYSYHYKPNSSEINDSDKWSFENANASYLEHYNFKSSEINNSNKWTFEYEDGVPTITFNGFIFGSRGYAKEPGFWGVEVERSLCGTLKLTIDPDMNYYFSKTN
jgi:hypothetical protein